MIHKVLIYTTVNSPRFDYVCSELFDTYELTTHASNWHEYTGPKIWYAATCAPSLGLHVSPTTDLSVWTLGHHPTMPQPVLRQFSGSRFSTESIPVVYLSEGHLGFDVFAAAFYMMSLAAEYGSEAKDQHGRYTGAETLKRLYKNRIPIVDLWRLMVQEVLSKYSETEIILKESQYELILSMDIDNWYAFKQKSLKKQLGGLVRDLMKFGIISGLKRISSWLGGPDPYDPLPVIELSKPKTIFILNAGTESQYNKNIRITSRHIDGLRTATNTSTIGLHQSYQDQDNEKTWSAEKEKLSVLTKSQISHSRYHYLKFIIPAGLRASLAIGINNDHSLLFANGFGWRAGTSLPIKWYDLERDLATELTLHPYVGMDTRLAERFKGNGKAATHWLISKYGTKLRELDLPFPLVIHNESLGSYGVWRGFYDFLPALISWEQKR